MRMQHAEDAHDPAMMIGSHWVPIHADRGDMQDRARDPGWSHYQTPIWAAAGHRNGTWPPDEEGRLRPTAPRISWSPPRMSGSVTASMPPETLRLLSFNAHSFGCVNTALPSRAPTVSFPFPSPRIIYHAVVAEFKLCSAGVRGGGNHSSA